jgi:hypothetical protein
LKDNLAELAMHFLLTIFAIKELTNKRVN